MHELPEDVMAQLLSLLGRGRLADVIGEGERLKAAYPDSSVLHNILGAAHAGLRQWDEALANYGRALEIRPDYAQAHNNLGIALNDKGAPDEAVARFRRALEIKPDYAEAYNNLGVALKSKGDTDEAVGCYRLALEIRPDYAEAHNNLGIALNDAGALDEAVASYRQALEARPDYAEAHSNLGATLLAKGMLDEAAASYRRALEIRPDFVEAHNNLGAALRAQGAVDEAMTCYRRALGIDPGNAEAHNNLDVALKSLGRFDEAVESYRRALASRPDYAEAHGNLGAALVDMGALDRGIESYRTALEIKPVLALARARKLHQLAHMCDWAGIEEDAAFIPKLGIDGEVVSPFAMLAMEDNPASQRIRTENYARATYRRTPLPAIPPPPAAPERLRIGYFSATYHSHPGMYLIAGLFENHDRDRFEILAYSYGPDRQDEMRRRAVAAFDRFEDVRTMSDEAIAKLARRDGLDIAIDVRGYTNDPRSGIFALRPAPIQISFLGYPSTMGAPFIDYLVADDWVIPEAQRDHYSENLIYLPNSYQVNDNKRQVAERPMTRAEFGLPEDGFVFCCFNNSYKIGPAEFDIWMRLLQQVEGSVLWLFKANRWAEANLRKEAEARGVDGARIVFAERLPQDQHLARHRLANLFLDTFNYNAHTTASDAMWVGLPVVTKLGQGFPARVCGSLLNAVGLPELITETYEDYERLALDLAMNPDMLAAVKRKLEETGRSSPLYDTPLFARHIEDGYRQAYRRYFEGLEPATIRVTP